MTYCVGILVREGLVMIADTRTNAGLDNVATFRKLHIFERAGEKAMAIATAGNLAVSQSAITLLSEGMRNPETGKVETLMDMPSMFACAQFVGRAVREARRAIGEGLEQEQDVGSFDVSMLLGGQVAGGRLRLFMVYAAGNFIEATSDTPYLQIGEHKYGKPILDRSVTETDHPRRGAEARPDLHGFDHPLQPRRRPADRPRDNQARRGAHRPQLSHRGGRALFPRPARALVGGAEGRAQGDPRPAVQILKDRRT